MNKYVSKEDALHLLQKYCAYQDRCHQEVRLKLLFYKIYGDDLEDIITQLIQDKYLDELRYTKSFVRGKVRIKKWGPNKIKQQLQQKEISDYCQRKAFEEVDGQLIEDNLRYWLDRKSKDYKNDSGFVKKQKLIKFLMNKGYSYPDILNHVDSYI